MHSLAWCDELTDPLAEKITQFVKDNPLSIAIGEQFLKKSQQSVINVNTLLSSLTTSLTLTRSYSTTTVLSDLLLERIAQDFREDRLCNIDSWSLALTECRLAGLKALFVAGTQSTVSQDQAFGDWPTKIMTKIKSWGPQQTNLGRAFNLQVNGASALWIVTAGGLNQDVQIALGSVLLKTTIGLTGTISADLPAAKAHKIIGTEGFHPVFLLDMQNRTKQLVGKFMVKASAAPDEQTAHIDFRITNWGPQQIKQGQEFNQQADGASAWWFKFRGQLLPSTPCHIKLDTLTLPTTINPHTSIISARLDNEKAHQIINLQGNHTMTLDCAEHLKTIGQFVVK